MLVSEEHPLKVYHAEIKFSGSLIDLRLEHPEKVYLRLSIVSGIFAVCKDVQSAKAYSSIFIRLLGKTMLPKLLQPANAEVPISVRPSGNSTVSNASQLANAS